ncbi:MAG: glycosyltransferase family 39 protein [Nitrospinales bacterium]
MPLNTIHKALVAAVLAGAALRMYFISNHPLDIDEVVRLEMASQSLSSILNESFANDLPEPNPPLFTLLLHASAAFDQSEFGVRFVSAAAGVVSIALVYLAGSRLFGRSTGLLAACLMAGSPFAVHYSLFAKQYALMALCSLALLLAFIKCLTVLNRRNAVLYFLAAQALLLTHYSGLFLLAGFFILYGIRPGGAVWRWTLLHACVLLAFTPYLVVIRDILTAGSTRVDWIPPIAADAAPRLFLIYFMGLEFIPKDPDSGVYYFRMAALWAVRLAAGYLFFIGARSALREFTTRFFKPQFNKPNAIPAIVAFVYLLFPLTAFIVFSFLFKPIYQVEYQMMVYPAFILILAHGAIASFSKKAKTLFVLSLAALWAWSLGHYFWDSRYTVQPWRTVVKHIAAKSQKEETLVFHEPLGQNAFRYYSRLSYPTAQIAKDGDVSAALRELKRLVGENASVWIVFCRDDGKLEQAVVEDQRFLSVLSKAVFNQIRVYHLGSRSVEPIPKKTARRPLQESSHGN